jgi:hypothetical protein
MRTIMIAVILLIFPLSAFGATCKLQCTRVTKNGETRVTTSCHNLNVAQCAAAARASSHGNVTCTGNMAATCP